MDRGLPISSFTLASKIICDVTYFDESCGEPPFSALLHVAFLMFSFSLPLVCRMFLTLRFTADQQGHMRDSIYLNKCVVSFSSPCCHSDVLSSLTLSDTCPLLFEKDHWVMHSITMDDSNMHSNIRMVNSLPPSDLLLLKLSCSLSHAFSCRTRTIFQLFISALMLPSKVICN